MGRASCTPPQASLSATPTVPTGCGGAADQRKSATGDQAPAHLHRRGLIVVASPADRGPPGSAQ
jgi:hypothetical protein